MDPLEDVLAVVDATSYLSAGLTAGGSWAVRFEPPHGVKFNPGWIHTNLQRNVDDATMRAMGAMDEQGRLLTPDFYKTPQQGAATSVLLAASPLVEGSAAGTSRTTTRRKSSRPAPTGPVSPRGPSTRTPRTACGTTPQPP